jgi:hypothetical protein
MVLIFVNSTASMYDKAFDGITESKFFQRVNQFSSIKFRI